MVMINLKLRLNQTQKVRYERAMKRLESLSSANNCVIVTDSIPVAVCRGHGVSQDGGEPQATVSGVLKRVDNLFTVCKSRAKYKPHTGDVVVGRVIEFAQGHWRVEVNSTRDGKLNLESVNMPNEGVQRRKTSEDKLKMRKIFVKDDVICAEVGEDGFLKLGVSPSHKYGKLEKGQLVKVDPYLVKETKPQFHCNIESLGIDLVLGRNGFIWIGEHKDPMIIVDHDKMISFESRENIIRIRNAIRVLSNLGFTLTKNVIMEAFDLSNTENINIHDMLGSEFHVLVAENQAETEEKEFH